MLDRVASDRGVLDLMAQEVRQWAISKGWRKPNDHGCPDALGRTFGDECALLHSEISEALEAFRVHGMEDVTDQSDAPQDAPHKPEGVASEMADLLIRLLDNCSQHGIDLFAEYRRKMDYNHTRAHRHGGKAL